MNSQHNTIRTFALIIAAVTSAFLMWMSYRLIEILAAPDWCARAINAEKLTTGRSTSAFETCKDLLILQVKSTATNSHISLGIVALCLLVLVVIVIAGGKLSFTASKTGVAANVGKDVEQAVDRVVSATEAEAQSIKGDGNG